MANYSIKASICPVQQLLVNRIIHVIAILLFALTALGCRSTIATLEHYENSEFGLSLQKPNNWEIKYHERNRSIEIEDQGGAVDANTAYITVRGIMLSPLPSSPEQELALSIDRIKNLYNLDSITIIQESVTSVENGYETGRITISIPSNSIPEGSHENRVGVYSPDVHQIIELHVTICPGNFTMVHIYQSNNAESNSDAKAIVDSMELVCLSEV